MHAVHEAGKLLRDTVKMLDRRLWQRSNFTGQISQACRYSVQKSLKLCSFVWGTRLRDCGSTLPPCVHRLRQHAFPCQQTLSAWFIFFWTTVWAAWDRLSVKTHLNYSGQNLSCTVVLQHDRHTCVVTWNDSRVVISSRSLWNVSKPICIMKKCWTHLHIRRQFFRTRE